MLETLIDRFGDGPVLFAGGLGVGILFGAAAQHSRFCLRAATIEFSEARIGPRMAVWLLAFLAAVACVQAGVAAGWMFPEQTRQIGATGSMSGAIVGGLMFGVGMILSRGCASRLLVLSATGNLRALLTGLVLTVVAQASLRGVLSGWREAIAAWWTVPGGQARDLLALIGIGPVPMVILSLLGIAGAVLLARARGVEMTRTGAALLVGVAVGLGWLFTFAMTQVSFEPLQASSVTFTGPSADTLMGLINEPVLPMNFNVGLVPGVFLGAGITAALTGEFRLQGFQGGPSMIRYMVGAGLMGFGAMLAGGCAVGAGVSGGAMFALTAWVALTFMWIGAMCTSWIERALAARSGTPAVA